MNALVLEQSKRSLAAQALQSWGRLKLRVNGASMIPTLWPGDLVTVESQGFDQVEPGHLVLYEREGRFVVHRAVRKAATPEGAVLITRGDCVAKEDAPIPAAALLGRVTQIERQEWILRPAMPARPLTAAQRILGSVLCRWDLLRNAVLRLRMRSSESPTREDFATVQSTP